MTRLGALGPLRDTAVSVFSYLQEGFFKLRLALRDFFGLIIRRFEHLNI